MLEIMFHEAADQEAAEAILWYELQEAGLGPRLRSEIDTSISRILRSPLTFPVIHRSNIRRAPLTRFPYSIIFALEDEYVVILAVFHSRRDPAAWQERLD
jgi:toxin ParE1/3/4